MLVRLDGAFAALSQFSAELAHEFRTPLHIMRQQTEVALVRARTPTEYGELLESNLEEIERLRRLVDDTLFLARAEDPRATILRAPLDVAAELRDVADYLEALAGDGGVSLAVDVRPGLTLAADRALFRRALVNLVTNALRHTPPGGHVTLAARDTAGAADRAVVVEVRDTGAGMAPGVVTHVFERYYRAPGADARGDGAGLGLAIVRGVMSLHGGTADATSAPGEGNAGFPPVPHGTALTRPTRRRRVSRGHVRWPNASTVRCGMREQRSDRATSPVAWAQLDFDAPPTVCVRTYVPFRTPLQIGPMVTASRNPATPQVHHRNGGVTRVSPSVHPAARRPVLRRPPQLKSTCTDLGRGNARTPI